MHESWLGGVADGVTLRVLGGNARQGQGQVNVKVKMQDPSATWGTQSEAGKALWPRADQGWPGMWRASAIVGARAHSDVISA